MYEVTGMRREIQLQGRKLTFFNQSCPDWTHPYPWEGREDLHSSGCGIFSLCHVGEWLTGWRQSPESWADFSVAHGGRGDDGTDRPALLRALQETGEAAALGFRYQLDGLRNDLEALWRHMALEGGAAFCNLRVGHIVALLAARGDSAASGEYLVIDSASETASERIRDSLTEMVPGTEIIKRVRSAAGLVTGFTCTYGCYWVRADQPRDFNLLHRL